MKKHGILIERLIETRREAEPLMGTSRYPPPYNPIDGGGNGLYGGSETHGRRDSARVR